MKKAADTQVGKFHKEIEVFSQNSQDRSTLDQKNKEEYAKLEKTINGKKKKVDKFNDTLKQLKIKIKQNTEDWDMKNENIRKIWECFVNENEDLLKSEQERWNEKLDIIKEYINTFNCQAQLRISI